MDAHMYLAHWGLSIVPFAPHADSRFLMPTPSHHEALAALHYCVRQGGEPAVLDGPAGCGKTLLLRALRRQLPRETHRVVFIPDAACKHVGLLSRVAFHLTGLNAHDAETAMNALLPMVAGQPEHATIVILLDDVPPDADRRWIEELRWLLSLDTERTRVCVLLAGAAATEHARDWPEWLRQRLFAQVRLRPLDPDVTPQYLEHRLRAAGCERPLFSAEAAGLIGLWSRGVPRLINRVAHLALQVGFMDQTERVDQCCVERALERIGRPAHGPPLRVALAAEA